MILKERLKKIRKELDMTQQEFANKIGMKQNTIATYEIGRAKPSDQCVRSICREFGVNERWLRTGNGEMFLPMDRNKELAKLTKQLLSEEPDSFKNRFISVLSNLTEEQWEFLADIAQKLVKEKE